MKKVPVFSTIAQSYVDTFKDVPRFLVLSCLFALLYFASSYAYFPYFENFLDTRILVEAGIFGEDEIIRQLPAVFGWALWFGLIYLMTCAAFVKNSVDASGSFGNTLWRIIKAGFYYLLMFVFITAAAVVFFIVAQYFAFMLIEKLASPQVLSSQARLQGIIMITMLSGMAASMLLYLGLMLRMAPLFANPFLRKEECVGFKKSFAMTKGSTIRLFVSYILTMLVPMALASFILNSFSVEMLESAYNFSLVGLLVFLIVVPLHGSFFARVYKALK